ncbi:hypothetical protein M406DRAFT_326490 [Cryphonectria parasitica EP155]|uniref:Uncharacterized protein n=1 Tax=Cryphonectria parasitica (strain ATCC 38755 / EP155) TaxID=660469 RepID=A0A9P4YCZ2_CRYP1|nr:uncharacterized protein M406DRAFT_326490 [Cryphonectria parasitica EP155]KAF3771091.1 hypothetical protein M406DRAFT_326490 [Cryphonectria parasitica EP155]
MFSPATIAALAPFILGLAQASAVEVPRELPHDVTLNPASPALVIGGGYDCYPYNDSDCYKKYWDQYKKCHPYDKPCYKDCHDYDDYNDHCKNYDKSYGKCYDRCYYDYDGCDKYKDCHKNDDSCYKKKKEEGYCQPDDTKCRDRHPYPHDFCKPWDWDCHKAKHEDKDYECHPRKDKNCYPDYPDYPDYDDDNHGVDPHHPKGYVKVVYHGPKGHYEQQVWPDGDEAWTNHDQFVVDHIKYYLEKEDKNVRCLPMKSWFPWIPLPIEKYQEKEEEYGKKVRIIKLKEPMPVEVIRCDFP